MFTISSIIEDIDRHCMVNNMVEDRFLYRVVYFINTGKRSEKHYCCSCSSNSVERWKMRFFT